MFILALFIKMKDKLNIQNGGMLYIWKIYTMSTKNLISVFDINMQI